MEADDTAEADRSELIHGQSVFDFPELYVFGPGNTSDQAAECEFLSYEKTRDDILWVDHDLHASVLVSDDPRYLLRGVTVPPAHYPAWLEGGPVKDRYTGQGRPYFLTFRGTNHRGWYNSSTVRPDLLKAFRNSTRSDIVIEMIPARHPYILPSGYESRYKERCES